MQTLKVLNKFAISLSITIGAFSSARAETQVSLPLSDKGAVLAGVITDQGNFRLDSVTGKFSAKFQVGGELFKDLNSAQMMKFCKTYQGSKYPQAINGVTDAIFASGPAPEALLDLASKVGAPVESSLAMVSVNAMVKFSEDAIMTKVYSKYPVSQVMGVASNLFKVSLDDVKARKAINVDLTGQAALACDLILGTAKLSYQVLIQHQQAEPVIFAPITADKIATISRQLMKKTFRDTPAMNAAVVGGMISKNLSDLNIATNLFEDRAAKDTYSREQWTAQTFKSLLQGLTDANTMQAKLVVDTDAEALATKMTEVSYPLKGDLITTEADVSAQGAK